MSTTLSEIALEAGLIKRDDIAKLNKLTAEGGLSVAVALVREFNVDEIALVAAIRKETRIPLLDPSGIQIDPDVTREYPKDICQRLRALPIALSLDSGLRGLRVAMADPTDLVAIAELRANCGCDLEVCLLPLSSIEELIERTYRGYATAVIKRPTTPLASPDNLFVTRRSPSNALQHLDESEVSVTMRMPLAAMLRAGGQNAEAQLRAIVQLLLSKGLITEQELIMALRANADDGSSS